MLDYRTPEGISATATRIAAVNIAASLILNRSTVPDEIERISLATFLIELGRDLAHALDEANDPYLDSHGEGA